MQIYRVFHEMNINAVYPIADYTWSIGYLLLATGKVEYADRTSNHNYYFKGRNWMSFRSNPDIPCYTGKITVSVGNESYVFY